jgi:putative peptidoglycan lipid II flippase
MHRLPRATMVVSVLYLLNAVAALGRERVITTSFGANRSLDSYFLALGIVTMVATVPGRAVSGPLIPALARIGRLSGDRQLRLASSVLTALCLLLALGAVCVALAAPGVIRVAAPGLSANELALLRQFVLYLAPLVLFLGLHEVWRSLFNAFFDFYTPLLAPVGNSLVTAVVIVLLRPTLGFNSLLVAALLGGTLQVGIMAAVWHVRHARLRFTWAPRDRHLWDLMGPWGWSAVLVVMSQVTIRVDGILGSFLPPGSITALSYGYRLAELATTLLIVSATTVAFPSLSRQVAEQDVPAFLSSCKRGCAGLALIVAPVSIGLVFFSQPVVRLLLGGGQFNDQAVNLTAQALSAYALGLVPIAVANYLANALYALLDMRLLAAQGVLALLLKLGVGFALVGPLGAVGVALSQTIMYVVLVPVLFKAVWWGAARQAANGDSQ